MHEAQKHYIKNLQQLFDDLHKQKNKEIIKRDKGTEDFLRGQESVHANINTKQQVARENKRNSVKVSGLNTRDTDASPEEKMRGSRVKGKVKDFIKIFNQEGSPKRKGTFEPPSRRPRGKDEGKGKVEDPVHVPTVKADEQVKMPSRSCNSILSDAAVPINQSSEVADQVNFNMSFDVRTIDDSSSERNDPLEACSVYQSIVAIKEQFGKFEVLHPGCHCLPWFLGKRLAGHLTLRLQQLDVRCETKTKEATLNKGCNVQEAQGSISHSFRFCTVKDRAMQELTVLICTRIWCV